MFKQVARTKRSQAQAGHMLSRTRRDERPTFFDYNLEASGCPYTNCQMCHSSEDGIEPGHS